MISILPRVRNLTRGAIAMAIRAVLFDLGNTLVAYYAAPDFPAVLRRCMGQCMAAVGVSPSQVDEDDLFARAKRLNTEREDHAVRLLSDRLQELLGRYAVLDGPKLDAACKAFLKPIFELARPDPEAIPLLESLRRRGIRTGIVSNTPWDSPATAWRQELARRGLLERVDAAVFCVDVGWRKPHPAAFARALNVLSIAPGQAIFVGDDPRWDVVGARRAGLCPVLLSSASAVVVDGCTIIRSLREVLRLVDEAAG